MCLLSVAACARFSSKEQSLLVVEATNLYADPGGNARIIAAVQPGEAVTDEAQISRFETAIERDGALTRSPWIRVATQHQQSGWAPAACFEPLEGVAGVWLNQKRLVCYFDEAIAKQCMALKAQSSTLKRQEDVVRWYRACQHLRDTMMFQLSHRPERLSDTRAADFSWLNEVFDPYVFQVIHDGQTPWLFMNYATILPVVKQSEGVQDDVFAALALRVFPQDSIESAFPAWKFQLDDDHSASRLGEGRHLELMVKLDQAATACPLFNLEIAAWKNRLIQDILGEDNAYWQPAGKALEELKIMEQRDFKSLNQADWQVIRRRIKDFESPEASGIRADLRSGM